MLHFFQKPWYRFLKNKLLEQGPFCGVTDCHYFGLHMMVVSMGFKARVVLLLPLLLACVQ